MPKTALIEVKYGRTTRPRPYESANASVGFTLQFDPEGPDADLDAEIEAALITCVAHVHGILGLDAPKAAVTRSKPNLEASGDLPAPKTKKDAAEKTDKKAETADPFDAPKTAEKPSKAAAAKADVDPFDAPAEEAAPKPPTRADVNAAIQAAVERLQEKGISDGPARITKIVRGYLAEDAGPPYSSNKVPEGSLADFISDLDKLGR